MSTAPGVPDRSTWLLALFASCEAVCRVEAAPISRNPSFSLVIAPFGPPQLTRTRKTSHMLAHICYCRLSLFPAAVSALACTAPSASCCTASFLILLSTVRCGYSNSAHFATVATLGSDYAQSSGLNGLEEEPPAAVYISSHRPQSGTSSVLKRSLKTRHSAFGGDMRLSTPTVSFRRRHKRPFPA